MHGTCNTVSSVDDEVESVTDLLHSEPDKS
jgi:hypothetical protein